MGKKKTPNQTKLLLVFPMEDFFGCAAVLEANPRLGCGVLTLLPFAFGAALGSTSTSGARNVETELFVFTLDCVETQISLVPFYSGSVWFENQKNTGCKLVIQESGYRYSGSLFLVWCRGEGKENFWEVFHDFLQIPF